MADVGADVTRIEATTLNAHDHHRPALHVSHGSGNTDEPEVHFYMYDAETGAMIQGWFPLAEIQAALNPNGAQ